MKIRDVVADAAGRLADAGFPAADAWQDVAVLARHVLGWSLTDWATRSTESAPDEFATALNDLARRRATREPVAYITGTREFFGRPFHVTRDVLIPRPETEGIVELVLGFSGVQLVGSARPLILDVGTGSGCLAITLALEMPNAQVVATDISPAALDVARDNARTLGARVEFIQAPFWPDALGPFNLIVSNPPYVPEADRRLLMPDVRDFEPAGALFGGPGGMDVIAELVPRAAKALAPGGTLLVEIGAGQSEGVSALVRSAGLELLAIHTDLQGIPRVVTAATRPS